MSETQEVGNLPSEEETAFDVAAITGAHEEPEGNQTVDHEPLDDERGDAELGLNLPDLETCVICEGSHPDCYCCCYCYRCLLFICFRLSSGDHLIEACKFVVEFLKSCREYLSVSIFRISTRGLKPITRAIVHGRSQVFVV